MIFGFLSAKKSGQHYELAELAVNKLKSANIIALVRGVIFKKKRQ